LVFSATGVAGVDAVTLLLEGRPVEVPTGEGTLTGRPLTRGDFTRFSPS
jgi:spore germination protein GerM